MRWDFFATGLGRMGTKYFVISVLWAIGDLCSLTPMMHHILT